METRRRTIILAAAVLAVAGAWEICGAADGTSANPASADPAASGVAAIVVAPAAAQLAEGGAKDGPPTDEKDKKSPPPAAEDEVDPDDPDAKPKKSTVDLSKLSPEERHVREGIQDFLRPTSCEFLEDGRVKMVFDFRAKSDDHSHIFSIPVGGTNKSVLRWTFREEEWVIGGDQGLRVSDKGLAMLKAWFIDDVEAEMEFRQYINQQARHLAAVVFANGKGQSLGSNYGSQCVILSGGQVGKAAGKPQAVNFDQLAKIKLVVRGGNFEAFREGSSRQNMKYSQKTYASGQIGLLWGGSVSGTVSKLTVIGKLDYKKTSDVIKGKTPSGKR